MSDIPRFSMKPAYKGYGMESDPIGWYVLYEDYAELRRDLLQVQGELDEAKRMCEHQERFKHEANQRAEKAEKSLAELQTRLAHMSED